MNKVLGDCENKEYNEGYSLLESISDSSGGWVGTR
ncbi:MAG: hypothetical protein ACI8RD_010858 [Bacillariaceae sp.]|jgi:hypothetical protein